MITEQEYQELIETLQQNFYELVLIIKKLPARDREKYLNANVLGDMSSFLEMNNGFEATCNMYRQTQENLLDDLINNNLIESDEDEDDDE